jgi:hypothetical protein
MMTGTAYRKVFLLEREAKKKERWNGAVSVLSIALSVARNTTTHIRQLDIRRTTRQQLLPVPAFAYRYDKKYDGK